MGRKKQVEPRRAGSDVLREQLTFAEEGKARELGQVLAGPRARG